LVSEGAINQVLALGGPDPISLRQAAEAVGIGSEKIHSVPESAFKAQTESSDPIEASRAGLSLRYAQGLLVDNGPALAAVAITLQPVKPFLTQLVGAVAR